MIMPYHTVSLAELESHASEYFAIFTSQLVNITFMLASKGCM